MERQIFCAKCSVIFHGAKRIYATKNLYIFRWVIGLILILAASTSGATVLDAQDHQFDLGVEQRSARWLPGEQYDILSGMMNHRMTDMVVEGNGNLPIVITRSFQQKRSRREGLSMFYMGLDLPRISYTTYGNTGYLGNNICNDLQLLNANPDDDKKHHLRSPITFSDGASQHYFFSTDSIEQPGEITRFPQQAEYVSATNWYAECKQADGINNADNSEEFVVYSPDGMEYVLSKVTAIDQGTWTSVTWRVTQIKDTYGNWLQFQYRNGWNRQQHLDSRWNTDRLEKITSDDGREVTLRYGENGVDPGLLTSVENTAGLPNPQMVTYSYADSYNTFTVTKNNTHSYKYEYESDANSDPTVRVRKITYPYGGTVQYIYDGSHRTTLDYSRYNLGRYKPLIERQVSDGGQYTFRRQVAGNNTFWRVINTPKGSITYRYRKSNRNPIYHDIDKEPYVQDGRIITKNEFSRIIDIGEEDSIPLRQVTYVYQSNGSVTSGFYHNNSQVMEGDLQKHGTTQIVPKLVYVRNFNPNETNPDTNRQYYRKFEDLDEFGNPKKIQEKSRD